ncbi:hypothetical protein N2152v2_005761 [Parachlorella kessleri]
MAPQLSNGAMEMEQEYVGPRQLINKYEYVRLLEQALHRLGYASVARQLEQASGIDMQPKSATEFRSAVLGGQWDTALQLLPQLVASGFDLKHAQFLLLRQKYIESVRRGDTAAALRCLRSELQPLQVNQKLLHRLAGLLLHPAASQQQQQQQQQVANGTAATDGAAASPVALVQGAASSPGWVGGGSREDVLAELCAHLPPSLMIPDGRLEELVEQALLAQLDKCQFHNATHLRMSLFADYQAGLEQLPTQPSQVLDKHTDEVWAVQFSHDGRHLASAAKDGCVILWSVSPSGEVGFLRYVFRSSSPVNIVAFSPTDDLLLVAGNDNVVRLFEVANPGGTGLRHEFKHHKDAVTACCWFPDGQQFLTAGHDYALYICGINGSIVRTVRQEQRLYDALVSRDGSTVVSVGQDKKLHLLRLSDGREASISEGPAAITCLSASLDGRYMLANLQSHVIHLWPLGDTAAPTHPSSAFPASRPGSADPLDALPSAPLQEYRVGEARPSRYVIRSTMGGAGNSFVASGSEDCKVYIWHRDSGDLLHVLEGHSGTVNAVAWNPRNQYQLASVSDDGTVRVWLAKVAMGYRQ